MKKIKGKNGGTLQLLEKGETANPFGRPIGSRNRSTILREILSTQNQFTNPLTRKPEKMEVEKAMELAVVGKALKGDVPAYKEIKDTVYGKNPDKQEVDVTVRLINERFERVCAWVDDRTAMTGETKQEVALIYIEKGREANLPESLLSLVAERFGV